MPNLLDAHFHFGIERSISSLEAGYNPDHALPAGGIVNGTHPADWPNIVELAKRHPQFIPALGIHPRKVEHCPHDWLERLQTIPKPANYMIGEIGLDASPKFRSSLPRQIELFSAQWQRAQSQQRIAIIHCVRALGPLLKVITSTPAQRPFLMHAYSGPVDLVAQLIDLGAYFSFNLQQLHSSAKRIRAVISEIPTDRILVESDQDMMEFFMLGYHPSNLMLTKLQRSYEIIAQIRQQTSASLIAQVERNFMQFQKHPSRPSYSDDNL
jgi:TatD DNase family protein